MAEDKSNSKSDTPDEGTAKMVAAVMESAPMKQLQEQLQEIMMLLQGGGEHQEPDGDEGAQPEGEGAPGMDDHEQQPPAEGEMPGGQGGAEAPGMGAGGEHGQDQEERRFHEGPPVEYNYEGDDEESVNGGAGMHDAHHMEDEAHYCYGSHCDHPCHAHHIHGPAVEHDEHSEHMPEHVTKHAASFASGTDGYIPNTVNTKPVKMSRYEATVNGYLKQLEEGDKKVKLSREEKERAELKARVDALEKERIQYSRGDKLRVLQFTEGVDLDVTQELKDTENLNEEQFSKHLDKIKVRYSRDPSLIQPIRVTEEGAGKPSPESRMNDDQRKKYARDIATRAMSIRSANGTLTEDAALEQARKELEAKFVA